MYMMANWKMHGSADGVKSFVHALDSACWNVPSSVRPIFFPPSVYLAPAHGSRSYGSRVQLGAQNVSAHAHGAYTGEISATMLYEMGARYVLVGHSERRQHHHEDDGIIKQKAMRAQEAGLIPVLCIGETAEQAQAGETQAVLRRQLAAAQGLDWQSLMIAYEPVWAIGSGKTPSPDDIAVNHGMIIQIMQEEGDSVPPVVYGGSVKPENATSILNVGVVSGALIGGASLDSAAMIQMLTTAGAVQKGE
jgi:triosephosphate isomerase